MSPTSKWSEGMGRKRGGEARFPLNLRFCYCVDKRTTFCTCCNYLSADDGAGGVA